MIQFPQETIIKNGIHGRLNNWINMFLANRKINVFVEVEQQDEVTINPGVPQRTILVPIFFLCRIMTFQFFCSTDRSKQLKDNEIRQEDLKQHGQTTQWNVVQYQ